MRKHQHRLCGAGASLGEGRRASEIYCLPGDFGWNDLGCWDALHEHSAGCVPEEVPLANVFDGATRIMS